MARIVIEFCNRARRSRSEYELIQHWTIWLLCCRRSPLPVQWLLRTQAGYLRLPEKGNTKACQQSKRTHEEKIRCLGALPHKRPPLHIQVVVCLRSGLGSGAILLSVPTPSKPNPARFHGTSCMSPMVTGWIKLQAGYPRQPGCPIRAEREWEKVSESEAWGLSLNPRLSVFIRRKN